MKTGMALTLVCGAMFSFCAVCQGTTPNPPECAKTYEIVRGPEVDADGVASYFLRNPFMRGESRVRFLYPKHKTDRLLFVLPVAPWPGFEDGWRKYGDGLAEVRKRDCHNRYGYTIIAPDFTEHMPWFVDHAADPLRRHESYMMQVLIPFVDEVLKTKRPRRDLVGFSKSGFGSLRLLLRYPNTFHACGVWDPGGITRPYEPTLTWSLGYAAGSAPQFEAHQIENAIAGNARFFRAKQRIVLAGYSNEKFKENLVAVRQLLLQAGIPHVYNDGLTMEHRWFTGWLGPVMASLEKLE